MDSQEGKKTTTKKPHDPFCDWQNNGFTLVLVNISIYVAKGN